MHTTRGSVAGGPGGRRVHWGVEGRPRLGTQVLYVLPCYLLLLYLPYTDLVDLMGCSRPYRDLLESNTTL